MKRDWKMIRAMLQLVENTSTAKYPLTYCQDHIATIYHHALLLGEGGLATVSKFTGRDKRNYVRIESLTDEGRSFLELSRDPIVWAEAMAVVDKLGGLDSGTLKLLLAKKAAEKTPSPTVS
mgnify:CR=1 FL=1